MELWVNFDKDFKEELKKVTLAPLVSDHRVIRRFAASVSFGSKLAKQVVSAIATIELPRGEWLELIGNLSVNANSEDPKIKTSALETLGYICEELVRAMLLTSLAPRLDPKRACQLNSDCLNDWSRS